MSAAVQNDVGWGAIVAVISATIGGFFMWLTQLRRSGTDVEVAAAAAQSAVEVAVMAEWQKLNGALSKRVSDLEEQLATARSDHAKEIENIRRSHANEMDLMRKSHRDEMRALRNQYDELKHYADGLRAQIAQNSQSAAHLMGDVNRKEEGNG